MTTCFDPYSNVKDNQYRAKLFLQAIDSINQADWSGCKVVLVISDDASKDFPQFSSRIPLWVTRNRRQLEGQVNNRENILHCCQVAEWVLVFDSDAVVRPDLLSFWRAHRNDNQLAGLNLFNSRFHKPGKLPLDVDKLIYKETVQGCGSMFRSGNWIPTWGDMAWEQSLNFMGKFQDKKWLVPRPSLMNHL